MSQVHLHLPSFNAGELSPLLGARFAVEKVQAGCRRLRNFIPHVHGPVFRRPGMEDMGAARSDEFKSRLAGFSFSTTTGFVLEFSPSGLQVWSNGVLVPLTDEVGLPYSEQECAELQIEQVNDVCYLVHANHPPRQLVRHADDDWRLSDIPWDWPPMRDENVRPEVITVPTVTTLLTRVTEEWPEFTMAATHGFDFQIVNPVLTGGTKTAVLQRWNGTGWSFIRTTTWTTSAPATFSGLVSAGTYRMTYTGPISAGQVVRTTETNGPFVTIATYNLDAGIFQPQQNVPVSVPAGQWQAVVTCPATVPAGATLWVQKRASPTSGTYANYVKLVLTPGATTETRMPTLTVATDFRFDWTGRAMAGTAKLEKLVFPTVAEITMTCSNTSGTGRTLTASEAIFQSGHEASYWQITHRRDNSTAEIISAVTTIAAATSNEITVTGSWNVFSYGIWATTLFLERKIGATWEIVRSWKGKKDRNVIANGEESQPSQMRLRVLAGTSEAATGADTPRFALECADARVDGLVKVTAVGTLNGDGRATTATVDVISALYATTATAIWTEGAFSDVRGFPRAIATHAGRLWFGGTRAEASKLWGSVANDYTNFRRSSFDDGSIAVSPAARASNAIQWMISFEKEMIIGTQGDEWTLSSTGDTLTPVDLQMLRRSGYGSAYAQAVPAGDAMVFIQRGGQRLRQLSPRSDAQQWSAVDLTVLAEHVGYTGFVAAAIMSAPMVILWMVNGAGQLLGMTIEREQNVFGWHVHTTDGTVESVAVVPNASADEVWISVLRNGARRIERLDGIVLGRDFSEPRALMYLDSARRYQFGAPSASLTGLAHLEGRTVSVLADGVALTGLVVTAGVVTLPDPVTYAVVGLPFTSELQPMRIEVPLRDGTAQSRRFKLTRVGLYLHQSFAGEVAEAPGSRFEKIPNSATSPALFTGDTEALVEARTREGFDVIVRQSLPLPLNIGSLTLKGDVYGE